MSTPTIASAAAASGAPYSHQFSHSSRRTDQYTGRVTAILDATTVSSPKRGSVTAFVCALMPRLLLSLPLSRRSPQQTHPQYSACAPHPAPPAVAGPLHQTAARSARSPAARSSAPTPAPLSASPDSPPPRYSVLRTAPS